VILKIKKWFSQFKPGFHVALSTGKKGFLKTRERVKKAPGYIKLIMVYLLGVGLALGFLWWNLSRYPPSVPFEETGQPDVHAFPHEEIALPETDNDISNNGDVVQDKSYDNNGEKEEQPPPEEDAAPGPMIWPVPYEEIVQGFGEIEKRTVYDVTEYGFNQGIDIRVSPGTQVKSVQKGKITKVIEDNLSYGKSVLLEHVCGNKQTLYKNLSRVSITEEEKVSQGDIIGEIEDAVMEDTEREEPYLHVQLKVNGDLVDPRDHLP